jgi:hypothetical protein
MQRTVAVLAGIFGLATILAGGRVLSGADPGYVVFRPLLIFNTAMGAAYVAAALVTWRSLRWGRYAAAGILGLNLLALGAILLLYGTGSAVAMDSLVAMTFRTAVWLGFFLALSRVRRRSSRDYAR